MRFRSLLFAAMLLAVIGYSCREKGGRNINQGEIHYSIEYIMDNPSFMPREIMPRALIVSFKKDKILFNISAPFGNSGIINLSNPVENIYDTYITLLSMRYYYPAKPGEPYPGFEAMKGIEIRKTARSTVICGFNCKNAEVTFPIDRNKVHNIWYTNDIRVKNPNASTPFSQIDGVLMDFFFLIGSAEMHFNAETVLRKEIPDKLFERRGKYMRASRDEITNIINKMINM